MFFKPLDELNKGLCVGEDPRRWDVENLNPLDLQGDAERLCSGCPVQKECLRQAEEVFYMEDFLPPRSWDELGREHLATTSVVQGGKVW